MRGRLASSFAALVVCGLPAKAAFAQDVLGTVRDSLNGFPVSGAVVMLLDSSRVTVRRNLTSDRGAYRIALDASARFLRVVRIGYEPRELPVPPAAGGDARIDVGMLEIPNMLSSVHVLPNSRCSRRNDRGAALALWEQARAGLLATVVARESNPAELIRLVFEHVMEAKGDRVLAMRVRTDTSDAAATSFYTSHSAEDLVRYGFSSDSTVSRTYFLPDADVLLSDYFAEAYCFEIANGGRARPNDVGLRFVPADRRRGRIDIDGTLWVDTAAHALKEIEYTYLGVDFRTRAFHAGGRISFRAMQNGVVLIDRWSLRLLSAASDSMIGPLGLRDWFYADETGGELARATWRDGLTWKAPLGALRLHAITADGKPAVGRVIALTATHYFATTDSNGMARISDLVPGPYGVRIIDPRIVPLGIGLPTPLRFVAARDSTALATIVVPTAESFVTDRCVAAHKPKSVPAGSFFVLGRVVTPDGQPVKDAEVSFTTDLGTLSGDSAPWQWLREDVTTSADGLFQACHDWSLHNEIFIRVHRPGTPDVDVKREFTSDLIVVKVPVQPFPHRKP
jgi:hypothetical protein